MLHHNVLCLNNRAAYSALRIGYSLATDMAVKVLEESVGKTVLIKLKGGKVIRGYLQGFDQHMNLVLENSEELSQDNNKQNLGTIVVRGDNVVMISPPPE